MEVQLQQEMQEVMVQQERLQRVRLLVVMQVVHLLGASLLMQLALGEQLRPAVEGHLEVAVGEHLEVAQILQAEEEHLEVAQILQVEVERHLVAPLELAAHPPWMQPLLLTPDSPLWCLNL